MELTIDGYNQIERKKLNQNAQEKIKELVNLRSLRNIFINK